MKRKFLISLFSIVCIISLMLVGCGNDAGTEGDTGDAGGEDEKYVMRMTHAYPETTQHGRNSLYFKKLVEEKTNGRVEVQIFPNAQLAGSDKEISLLQSGAVEAAYSICGAIETIEPLEAIYTIPFIWKSSPLDSTHYIMANQYDSLIEETLREKLKEKGIYRLGIVNTQNGQFIAANNKRPILKPEDMEGLKIRHSGGLLSALSIEKLGAAPITVAGAEVTVGLTQGVFDGLQTGILHYHDAQWYTKYVTLPYSKCYSIPMLLNLKWWESLPEDLQDIIQNEVMPEVQKYGNDETTRGNKEAYEAIQKPPHNVEVYMVPDEELEDWANYNNVRDAAIEKFLSVVGPEGQKLIDEVYRLREQLE